MKLIDYIHENFYKSILENKEDIDNRFGLPYPYTVPSPGDVFDCMFYWDTHFTNVGLIPDGNIQQAIYNTDNIRHMVERFGYMPNSSKAHHLGQSQPPFYCRMVSDIFDVTGDVAWLGSHYDSLAKEYAFWMTQRLAPNGLNYYGRLREVPEDEIQRRLPYCVGRFAGYEADTPQKQLSVVQTVATLCESGWDCCYRFEMDGLAYNPVDLNALLYYLESSMIQFSRILSRGEEQLWRDRASVRKEKMDRFMFCKEKGFYMDWNFVEEKFSPVVSAASLFPLYLGMEHDPEPIMKVLEEEMLLPFGVAGTVKPEHPYDLQWEYPNVWAPIQYVAYYACLQAGKKELAQTIARRYMTLLEENFEKTGNLWEKYDGRSGEVVNSEYEAPPMLGWTAGSYLAFYQEFLKEKTCNL